LLWVNNHQNTFEGKTLPTGVQYAAYDGNGNVAALVKATDGSLTARYDYGPFAEPIRASGSMAKANPIRFSTKYTDYESGLVYYGYRYYGPTIGRWISRDPMGESQDPPLYVSCNNAHPDRFDLHGLKSRCACLSVDILVASSPTLEKAAGSPAGFPLPTTAWSLGLKITYKVRVTGDPSSCVCTIREKGTVQSFIPPLPSTYLPLSETREIPCGRPPPDHPGVGLDLPASGTFTYILDYDLRQTLICQGSSPYGQSPSKSVHIKKMFSAAQQVPPR